MLRRLASAAALALVARPALAETWRVMGASPAELLLMETDTRLVQPDGRVSVWTSTVTGADTEKPVVRARWEIACTGAPRIRPQMVVWYDSALKIRDTWTAGAKDRLQAVVPGSHGDLTYQFACGRKAWPISVSGSFGQVAAAYADALEKLVGQTEVIAK